MHHHLVRFFFSYFRQSIFQLSCFLNISSINIPFVSFKLWSYSVIICTIEKSLTWKVSSNIFHAFARFSFSHTMTTKSSLMNKIKVKCAIYFFSLKVFSINDFLPTIVGKFIEVTSHLIRSHISSLFKITIIFNFHTK